MNDNEKSTRHLIDASQKLPQLQVRPTLAYRWRSCIFCRRISLRSTPSCFTHRLGLMQEEWAEVPKNARQMYLRHIGANAPWWEHRVNDTRSIG